MASGLVSGAAALVLVGALSATARARCQAASPSLVFDQVTVVDVEHGQLLPAQRVVITGTRIRAVGSAAKVRVPPGARRVDARGKYLIPGLWDMHFHTGDRPVQPYYSLLIANGITGIRDPNQYNPIDSVRRWQQEIARGTRVGPRQVVTGAMLESDNIPNKGGQGFHVLRARTPAEARRVTDSLHQIGAEFVKTHQDGLSRETFFALAAEARRVGIRLEGHLPTAVGMIEASDSGMRIIDHLLLLIYHDHLQGTCDGDSATVERCTALAAHLSRNGTWIVVGPTWRPGPMRSRLPNFPDSLRGPPPPLSPEEHRRVERGRRIVDLMRQAGMPLLSGTDVTPNLIHEELDYLVDRGLTPLAALQTATLNPAKYLRGTDSLGTIAPGKLADLVLLDGDPLADITQTTAIRAVVANGRYFDRPALDRLFAEVEAKMHWEP